MATQSKAVKSVIIPVARQADGSLDTTQLVNEIGHRLATFGGLAVQLNTIKHESEKLKTAEKAVKLKQKDAKKAINELLPQLRKAKVKIGSLNPKDSTKDCPVARAIYDMLPDGLTHGVRRQYVSNLRLAIKDNHAWSTNPSRDKAAATIAKAKDQTKGILESHARTEKLSAVGKLKLVMPELVKLALEIGNVDLLTCFEDAQEIVSNLK